MREILRLYKRARTEKEQQEKQSAREEKKRRKALEAAERQQMKNIVYNAIEDAKWAAAKGETRLNVLNLNQPDFKYHTAANAEEQGIDNLDPVPKKIALELRKRGFDIVFTDWEYNEEYTGQRRKVYLAISWNPKNRRTEL